jgi:predicted transcriptional regulator
VGLTKSTHFTDEQNELAALFKSLGHPARIAILQLLLRQTSCICGDIVDELPVAQPTISQHLKELKAVGIIHGTISGNAICYCINPDKITVIQLAVASFIPSKIDTASTCC